MRLRPPVCLVLVDVHTFPQCRAARCSTVHGGHHHLRRRGEGALYPEGVLGAPPHQGKEPTVPCP